MFSSKNVNLSELILDPLNPRFTTRENKNFNEKEIINYLIEYEELLPLAKSINEFGGFTAGERIIVVIDEVTKKYIVLEGNRRISSLKLLMNPDITSKIVPKISNDCLKFTNAIPVDIVSSREEANQTLLIRHIDGIRVWPQFSKMKFYKRLFDNGQSIDSIVAISPDTKRKIIQCLQKYDVLVKTIESYKILNPESKFLNGTTDAELHTDFITSRIFSYYIKAEGLNLKFSEKNHSLLLPTDLAQKDILLNIFVSVAKLYWEDEVINSRILNRKSEVENFFDGKKVQKLLHLQDNKTYLALLELLKKYKKNSPVEDNSTFILINSIQDANENSDTPNPAQDASANSDTPDPAQDASANSDTPDPAQDANENSDTPDPAQDASANSDTPDPAQDANENSDTPDPAQDANENSDTPDPAQDASANSDTPDPAQDASENSDTPDPAQDASANSDTPDPAQDASENSDTPDPAQDASANSNKQGIKNGTGNTGRRYKKPSEHDFLLKAYPFKNNYRKNNRINKLLTELNELEYKKFGISTNFLLRSLLESYAFEYTKIFSDRERILPNELRLKGLTIKNFANTELNEKFSGYIGKHMGKIENGKYITVEARIEILFSKSNHVSLTQKLNNFVHSPDSNPMYLENLETWENIKIIVCAMDEIINEFAK